MIVVDASVAVKWYVEERDSRLADSLLEGQGLIAPELLRVEVFSGLCNQARLYGKPVEIVKPLCERWLHDLGRHALRLFPQGELMGPACDHALRLRHSLADCIYLALAEREGAALVTADAAFAEKARASYKAVRVLGE